MSMHPRAVRGGVLVACAVQALLLAGCSPGDVQFNGKLFDALGVNGSSAPKVPKMAERSGLVVPPSMEKLPEPGSGHTPDVALADVKDPDNLKKVSHAELEQQQAAYCKEHYELAKLRGDLSADAAKGPLGLCRGSVLTALQKLNKGPSEDDQ